MSSDTSPRLSPQPSSSDLTFNFTSDVHGFAKDLTKPVYNILLASAQNNINALVVFALQELGYGLIVDADLIQNGAAAFNSSQRKILNVIKIAIGLPQDPVSRAMQENPHFVASFLLAVSCKPSLNAKEAGQLLYELMKLRRVPFTPSVDGTLISDTIQLLWGYGDHIIGASASDIYNKISEIVRERQTDFPELDKKHSVKTFAKMIDRIFDALKNDENRQIIVRGTYGALFIATIFLWLRPEDTVFSIQSAQVYPDTVPKPRLWIDLTLQSPEMRWTIEEWRPGTNLSGILAEFQHPSLTLNQYYPLQSARSVITGILASDKSRATGQLAASLVNLLVEVGSLRSEHTLQPKLIEEISEDLLFLRHYDNILTRFGWNDIDKSLQERVTTSLKEQLDETLVNNSHIGQDNDVVKTFLFEAYKKYYDDCSEFMITNTEEAFDDIIPYGIHLAVEALLLFSLSTDYSNMFKFRSPEAYRVNENIKIFRHIILGHNDDQSVRLKGLPFSEFRVQAMNAMLPGGISSIYACDLAVSGNGYVVYATALECFADSQDNTHKSRRLRRSNTEKERCVTLQMIPGNLKLREGGRRFERLTELPKPPATKVAQCYYPVNPFNQDGKYQGFKITDMKDESPAEIEHLFASPEDIGAGNEKFGSQALFISTALRTTNQDIIPELKYLDEVPLSWKNSIEAFAFAEIVGNFKTSLKREEVLAGIWRQKGYFSDMIQKCPPGILLSERVGIIAMTLSNEKYRFFESGRFSHAGRVVVVRESSASLVDCISKAVDKCGDTLSWSIIT